MKSMVETPVGKVVAMTTARRGRKERHRTRSRLLLGVGLAFLVSLILPVSAMAYEAWANEQAMRDSTYVAGRNTFIFDPGVGNYIPRQAFVQSPLKGYYEARGFDANFLTWAHVRTFEPGSAQWSGCVVTSHPEPCPLGSFSFDPVRDAIASGPITGLYSGGAFIATACGNFSPGGASGPMPRITGVKYEDLNGDGKRDGNDPGLAGWTIKLLYEGKEVASTTTAGDGSYSFNLDADHLAIGAGSYKVEEVQKPGWVASQTPGAISVPLQAEGTTYAHRDFGNVRPAEISGHKFDDSNVSGVRDPLEEGLPNWAISVSNGNKTLTDGAGAYSFSVWPGTYTVSEGAKAGWRQTDPGGKGTRTFTVISGQVIEGADFGNVCLGGVSVSPVNDSTGEPVPMEVRLEENEVPGVLSNEPSLPRTESGTSTFGELLPGTYRVVAFLPEGVFTTDPDAVPVEGRFAIVKEVTVGECESTDVPLHLFTASTSGKVTGGVKIDVSDGFATSGFEFMTGDTGPRGTLQYVDHSTGLDLHTAAIEAIDVEGEIAVIWGTALVGESDEQFQLRLVDAGEPGTADRFQLTLADGYAAGKGETIAGGNVQIHG